MERVQHSTKSSQRLIAARVLGSAPMVIMGQFVVHMPMGFWGPAGHSNSFGFYYSIATAFLSIVLVIAAFKGASWARFVSSLLFAVHLSFFVPPLASDTVIAGVIVLWHLLLLLSQVLGLGFGQVSEEPAQFILSKNPIDEWLVTNAPAARHLLMASLLVTICGIGFGYGKLDFVVWLVLSLHFIAILGCLPFWRFLFFHDRRMVMVGLLPILGAVLSMSIAELAIGMLAVHQLVALMLLWSRGAVFQELVDFFFRRPAALAMSSFAAVIALGALLLSFPVASADGLGVSPLDALFTATSATCVTGLIVVDTPTVFSSFGHGVILGLIQVGGIGIMVLSAFAALLLGGRLGRKGEQALAQLLDSSGTQEAYRLTIFVVFSTLAIEFVGAVLLTFSFLHHGLELHHAIWRGIFHSISAFCNAGFSLQTDSLVMFQHDPFALMVFSVLITLGGIGFLVLAGTWRWVVSRHAPPLKVHIKVVLGISTILVVTGFTLYLIGEWNSSLAGLSFGDKLVNALFQSVTLRTAGFNSVDMGALHSGTSIMMIALMFIGASPGGTGGGIKTTTLMVILASIRATAFGENRLIIDRQKIPQRVIFRSMAIAAMALGIMFLAIFILAFSQGGSIESLAFEVTSAIGTVGLSLGITQNLQPLGKLVIILVMFAGRLGPLTLALLLGRSTESRVWYPEVRFLVG